MPHILVVEDEKDQREVLAYNLRQVGHSAVAVGTVYGAMAAVRERGPDLVLLDLMLPDGSGAELCRKLQGDPATADVPIVMVTAKAEEADRIGGLELGAADYVVKPYSLRELLLRVEAVLRRAPRTPSVGRGGVFKAGRLRVDRDARRVWVGEREVTLTSIELRLLSTLLERQGRVLSRSGLVDHVWGLNVEVAMRSVDANVKRVRQKLGSAGGWIETVRGVGYRFAPVPDQTEAV